MYAKDVARSVGLYSLMQASKARLPATLDWLPEPLGFVPRALPNGGVLIRTIPREVKEGRVLLAPLFSLMGGSGKHTPLLLTLLERDSRALREFFEEVLCVLVAPLWLKMALDGWILEAHGQDLLLALSLPDLKTLGRVYYKDFEGLQVDWALRAGRGLPAPALPRAWRWWETYNTRPEVYGQCIWSKLGNSLIQYLFMFLKECEHSLRQWHAQGLIGGKPLAEGELTMMFSHHLMQAIEVEFNVPVAPRYDISNHLKKFVLLLMRLRHQILLSS